MKGLFSTINTTGKVVLDSFPSSASVHDQILCSCAVKPVSGVQNILYTKTYIYRDSKASAAATTYYRGLFCLSIQSRPSGTFTHV